jgi:hypothetical protein
VTAKIEKQFNSLMDNFSFSKENFIRKSKNIEKSEQLDLFKDCSKLENNFKLISKNCNVRSQRNTCSINRNRSCIESNCVLYSLTKIISNLSSPDGPEYQFMYYFNSCNVRTDKHTCSINSNKPCLARNCVLFKFLKLLQSQLH